MVPWFCLWVRAHPEPTCMYTWLPKVCHGTDLWACSLLEQQNHLVSFWFMVVYSASGCSGLVPLTFPHVQEVCHIYLLFIILDDSMADLIAYMSDNLSSCTLQREGLQISNFLWRTLKISWRKRKEVTLLLLKMQSKCPDGRSHTFVGEMFCCTWNTLGDSVRISEHTSKWCSL